MEDILNYPVLKGPLPQIEKKQNIDKRRKKKYKMK